MFWKCAKAFFLLLGYEPETGGEGERGHGLGDAVPATGKRGRSFLSSSGTVVFASIPILHLQLGPSTLFRPAVHGRVRALRLRVRDVMSVAAHVGRGTLRRWAVRSSVDVRASALPGLPHAAPSGCRSHLPLPSSATSTRNNCSPFFSIVLAGA